jgi:hypothetical protein
MGNTEKKKAAGNVQVIAAADANKQAHYAMLLKRFSGNHAGAQTVRLCNALKNAPVTSYDARKYLDVYDVPARIMELRKHGYQIETLRVAQETDAGVLHRRIGLYVLRGEVRHE